MRKGNTLNNKGFTLVELIISMALGLLIAGIAVQMYLESKLSYVQDEELARLQENARFSLDFLKREIALSGFFGGIADRTTVAAQSVTTDCGNGADWALDVSETFELVNNNDGVNTPVSINGTTWDCVTAADLVAGTDLFSVKRTSDAPTLRNGVMNTGSEDLNQWYLRVFDYNTYALTYLTSAIPSSQKTPNSTYDYWEFYSKIFYIRNFADVGGDGIPTLCNLTLVNDEITNQCLIEGVEDLQIEVGLDGDGDGTVEQYKASPLATDFANIRSIRLYLLMRSINDIPGYTNDKTYHLGQKTVSAFNDGFIRKVFTTTIKLRNLDLG